MKSSSLTQANFPPKMKNKRIKGIFVLTTRFGHWQSSKWTGERDWSYWGHLKQSLIVLEWSDCWFFFEYDFTKGCW